jgi:hypothetical protein
MEPPTSTLALLEKARGGDEEALSRAFEGAGNSAELLKLTADEKAQTSRNDSSESSSYFTASDA